MVALTFYFSHP